IGAEPALTDEERETERRRLHGSAGRVGAEASARDSAHWIGVLELYGLLPNFTLVDDAVDLEATVIWQDEEDRWQHEAASYARSGQAALTELAPGARFYAHGRELEIDAVDIGVGGSALQPTAFCPRCGHVLTFDRGTPPSPCPACGGRDLADAGQPRDGVAPPRRHPLRPPPHLLPLPPAVTVPRVRRPRYRRRRPAPRPRRPHPRLLDHEPQPHPHRRPRRRPRPGPLRHRAVGLLPRRRAAPALERGRHRIRHVPGRRHHAHPPQPGPPPPGRRQAPPLRQGPSTEERRAGEADVTG